MVIVILTFLFILFCVSVVYIYQEVKRIQAEDNTSYLETQKETYLKLVNGSGNYSTKALNPKITIIEFTDFACPYCRQAALEIRPLIEKYGDDIKLVIRDFPVHENSIDLAIAMRCAGEQGKYWDAYDLIFQEQERFNKNDEILKENLLIWAESLNLNISQFDTCFSEKRYVNLIKRDYDDGITLKIKGTPTWYINNYPLTGYYPADKFQEILDGILNSGESAEKT